MGKRRIRCLRSLGFTDITGVDCREDRRQEVQSTASIRTVDRIDAGMLAGVDAVIISTPPDHHMEYLRAAVKAGKPAFVEASVIDSGLAELDSLARQRKIVIAPSCTLRFHPAIQHIVSLVEGG